MCLDLLAIQSSSSLYHRQCPGDEAKIFSVLAKHTPYSIVIFSCLSCRRFILIFLTLFQQTKAILWQANSFHLHFLTFLSTQVPLL